MSTYDVRKTEEQWRFAQEGDANPIASFDTKKEALEYARDYMKAHGGLLRIWKEDDSLQEERSFMLEGEATPTTSAAKEAVAVETAAMTAIESPAPVTKTAGIVDAMLRGAKDATEAVGEFIPETGKYLTQGLYQASYYAAYGVVFGAVAIGRLVPLPKPLALGLHDGAQAALGAFEKGHEAAPTTTETAATA